MNAHMNRIGCKQLKIVWSIILLLAILVVHDLAWAQSSANFPFHDKSMLSNISVDISIWMSRTKNQFVSVFHNERFSSEECITSMGAESRPIISSGSNSDWFVASPTETIGDSLFAIRVFMLSAAKMRLSVPQFALRSVKPLATGKTRNILFQFRPMYSCNSPKFSPSFFQNGSFLEGNKITFAVAINILEPESARRQPHGLTASSAFSNHASNCTESVREAKRWKQKDLAHFQGPWTRL